MAENPKKQKGRNHWYALALLAVLVLAVAAVSAKYVQKTQSKNDALAKGFYFTSDLLDGKTHNVTALGSDGTASVTITLQNHADELRYSETKIDYTVTVMGEGSPTIDKPTGTIAAGKGNDAKVTISGLKVGETYTVTAKTENTYQQEIQGKIIVNEPDLNVYSSVEGTDPVEVTVWTVDYSGNVKMTYPSGWIPDNNNYMMGDWKTNGGFQTFSMDKNQSHVFRFFKGSNPGNDSEVSVNAAN